MSPGRVCTHQANGRSDDCLRRERERARARRRAAGAKPDYLRQVARMADRRDRAWAETEPEWFWPELAS